MTISILEACSFVDGVAGAVIRSGRRRAAAASNAGVLPPDLLSDVLLLLPAKELCRLRAVCRSWRSLTFDPLFVGEIGRAHV